MYEQSENEKIHRAKYSLMTISQGTLQEETSAALVGIEEEIITEEGTIYIAAKRKGGEPNSFRYVKDSSIIDIKGHLDRDEILHIIGCTETTD